MIPFNRQLIALNMLSQDMADELADSKIQDGQQVSETYLRLLDQYLDISKMLLLSARDLTENGFVEAIAQQGMCLHLVSKKMLMVQNRLVEYALDYYAANEKLLGIREVDFSEQAEVRFDLLTTRAIKSKSQYRTVALAMNKTDYQRFIQGVCLADFDWSWETLTQSS